MSSTMDNNVRIRICNDNQQAGDILEQGLKEYDDGEVQVIGRRRVRGQTSMPNIWAKYDGDRISVSFNENGLSDQINSKPKRVRLSDWSKLVKAWNKENSKKVAQKAKANGEKKMVQVGDKKRYAMVREELEEYLTGNKLTRKEMFRACFIKDP